MRVLKLFDYFFILRPVLFFPGWTTTFAGYLAARHVFDFKWDNALAADWRLLGVCLSSAMLMGAGFIVNQIHDAESDRINQKLFFLSNDVVTRRSVIVQACLLSAGSLILAWMISLTMFLIHLPALVLITVMYNLKPFALKDKPFGSLLSNAFMGLFALAFGWFLVESSMALFFRQALPYFFFNTGLYFLTTVPDAGGDAQTRKKTIAVVYGIPAAIYCAAAFESAAVVLAAMHGNWIILVPCLLVLPFYILMIINKNMPSVIRTIKFGLLFFSLSVGIFFPAYPVLIVVFFFATRAYYRKRFDVNYPSLKGE